MAAQGKKKEPETQNPEAESDARASRSRNASAAKSKPIPNLQLQQVSPQKGKLSTRSSQAKATLETKGADKSGKVPIDMLGFTNQIIQEPKKQQRSAKKTKDQQSAAVIERSLCENESIENSSQTQNQVLPIKTRSR